MAAPKVISRVGSMQNLVDRVLQPIVENYFRNSAQGYTVLDFLSARSQRQWRLFVIVGEVTSRFYDFEQQSNKGTKGEEINRPHSGT